MKQRVLLELLNKEDSLNTIQNYIKQVIAMRGFKNQTIEEGVLLLIEKVGELSKSIRKENKKVDSMKIRNYDSIESEIADIFIVLLSICNTLDMNLYDAMIEKENINVERTWSFMNKNVC